MSNTLTKALPEISEEDQQWLHYNPNTSDIVDWIHEYARKAIESSQVGQPTLPLSDEQINAVREAVAQAIGGDAYDCTRVWHAWNVGTMTQDDFCGIADDSDRVEEIADAAISAVFLSAAPPAPSNFERAEDAMKDWPQWKRDVTLTKHSKPSSEQAQPSLQQPHDELRRAVRVITNTLESGEWAELVSDDPDASALESAITKLVGAANIAQPVAPDLQAIQDCIESGTGFLLHTAEGLKAIDPKDMFLTPEDIELRKVAEAVREAAAKECNLWQQGYAGSGNSTAVGAHIMALDIDAIIESVKGK